MSSKDWVSDNSLPSGILWKSALLAIFLEAAIVTGIGWHEHWLAHPPKTSEDDQRFIQAEVFKMPSEAHLVEEKKSSAPQAKPEKAISKVPVKGPLAPQSSQASLDEENKTDSGPKMTPSHGPVAVYSPPPVIPTYLQDKEIKTHVVIDFYISAQGGFNPRLAGSSGNEELDAIAIEAVKKWVFRPAEKEGKPIDAKVRLRIVFVVQ